MVEIIITYSCRAPPNLNSELSTQLSRFGLNTALFMHQDDQDSGDC